MAHPTIADTERVHTYTVVASQDTFAVTFPVFKRDGSTGNGDIDVYVDGVLQSPSTWSFSGTFSDGVANGGNVVLDTAISSGTVRIVGHITAQRDSDYAAGGIKTAFLNTDFDRLVAMHREGQLRDMRALKIPAYEDDSDETPVDQVVPDLADRKGKVLGFDLTTGRPKVSSKSLADFDSGALPANKTADTLSDLKALTPEVGDVALLLGHQSINDYGGGHFYWDENSSASGDDALTILPTGHSGNGRWLRILGAALTPQMFGAVVDGATDDATAIQAAIDAAETSGDPVYFPPGTYAVGSAIHVVGTGRVLFGAGRNKSIIKATAGGFDVVQWGDPATDTTGWCQRGSLSDLSIQGHASSTGGLIVGGPNDDNATWSTASRGNHFTRLRIFDIGNGPAVRNSAWVNHYDTVECWDSLRGFQVGEESYSLLVTNLYSSGCTNQGLYIPSSVTASESTQMSFKGIVVQDCGASGNMVELAGGSVIDIDGLYTENIAAGGSRVVSIEATNVSLRNMMYSAAGSSVTNHDIVYVTGNDAGAFVSNVLNFSDCNAVLHIVGTTPTVFHSAIRDPSSLATNGEIFDESTRKITMGMDSFEGLLPPSKIRALTSENALEFIDSATGTVKAFIKDDVLYFGADTTAPNLSVTGSTVHVNNGGSIGFIRVSQALIGGNSIRIRTGSGTPEGAVTGDVGSLFLRDDGGAGTTLYVKESGTGNTGWVAK